MTELRKANGLVKNNHTVYIGWPQKYHDNNAYIELHKQGAVMLVYGQLRRYIVRGPWHDVRQTDLYNEYYKDKKILVSGICQITLAKKLGMSRESINRCIKVLEKKRLIVIKKVRVGKKTYNTYILGVGKKTGDWLFADIVFGNCSEEEKIHCYERDKKVVFNVT